MWTSIERMGSGLDTALSPRVHIIHVTALQPLFVHVWVWYISICTVMHPVQLSVVLDEISTCQALCTVPTKRCVLCQPNDVYCANQTLFTVPTKRCVLCQPNALYCANQALRTVPTKRYVLCQTSVPPKRCILCQPNASYCAHQALCTVPTKRYVLCQTSVPPKRCILCQPNASYCAKQALYTVPTKHYVLCQPSAVYCANQALFTVPNERWYWPNNCHFHRIALHGGSHAHVEAKGPIAVPELVFRHVGKPAAKSDIRLCHNHPSERKEHGISQQASGILRTNICPQNLAYVQVVR